MTKKPSVTVAIPAYNEEATIATLLTQILAQTVSSYTLEKVIVISDGSTDTTIEQVQSISDRRIAIKHYTSRKGKVRRLNELFASTTNDILIILDADIALDNLAVLDQLITPFASNPSLAIVYGTPLPVHPHTYTGSLAYLGYRIWEKAKTLVESPRYSKCGPIMAMSRQFYTAYRIPEDHYVTEDTYSFYYCEKHGFTTHVAPRATVHFHLPSTVHDYLSQMNRYLTTTSDMRRYFGDPLVRRYETITPRIKLKALILTLFTTPLTTVIGYVVLQFIAKLRSMYFVESATWEMAKSSKRRI